MSLKVSKKSTSSSPLRSLPGILQAARAHLANLTLHLEDGPGDLVRDHDAREAYTDDEQREAREQRDEHGALRACDGRGLLLQRARACDSSCCCCFLSRSSCPWASVLKASSSAGLSL